MVFLRILGGFVGFVVWMVVAAIFHGFALSVLWKWFMVPAFGLPELPIPTAIGVALVVTYLTYQHIDCENERDKEKSLAKKIVMWVVLTILRPSFALLVGWIVQMFM